MPIALAPQFTQRAHQWASWKIVQATKSSTHQYDDDGSTYTIWFYDGPEVHICTIWKETLPDGVIAGGYSQAQNDADKAEFEAVYKANANKPLELRTTDGRSRVATEKSDAAKITLFSHDWTDPTTWTTKAIRVVEEVATDDGAHTAYSLAHNNIIDTYHGKITQEDFLKDASANSFRATVKVNDVIKIEQDPHLGSGGDYTVNYAQGKVTFLSALATEDVVKVTYHYATGSEFVVCPAAGKALRLSLVEVQFADDIALTDTVVFQPYGYVDVFAPQLMASPYNIPSGTKIPLGSPVKYKTMTDYQNDAVRAFPAYPALGGAGWRGSPRSIIIFDWDYVSQTLLRSSYGMEVRIALEHDVPFGGWYATATFYCTVENET